MSAITIEEALKNFDRRYFSLKLKDETLNAFINNLKRYRNRTSEAIAKKESEEHLKNLTNSFLGSFYHSERYKINTDKNIDSAISVDGQLRAIIETKRPSNKNEMASKDHVNTKALHEILYYYMIETRDTSGVKVRRKQNVEIRRCIITDTQIWVLIDANEIEKLVDGYLEKYFYKYVNHQLIYANDNNKFYEDIGQYLDTIDVNKKLQYVYFNIGEINTFAQASKLYKIFHEIYLLKETARYYESVHTLNEKFYQELLYLMGLKEKSGKSGKTIEIDHSIKNSLADQVYTILKNDKEYDEIPCIEKTFELVIIWINRLLFIKLFEGRLIAFNGDSPEYHILDNSKVSSFHDLQYLFFNVLGTKVREKTMLAQKFASIPYLNSSLFERYKVEREELNINVIQNLPIHRKKNSIVGNKTVNEIPLLDYILGFLNAYSFSSEIGKDNTLVSGRDIIDSSVLGLIFEKLNGYRDGSFYTPSVITEYMSAESIERTVITAINKAKKWNCSSIFEIRSNMGSTLRDAREINNIINRIRVCDISVGSGHFLVSALNQIIWIKKQLGVLFKYNKDELLTEYDIDVVDDTIRIYNGQGKPFYYDKNDALSQIVQETLFNEKRTIIENCLFGVDINSKAVSICQLRLWIELLKNAYYKNGIMETLPNIDINIKTGNSLINRLKFSIGETVGKNSNFSKSTTALIKNYKESVAKYKAESNKTEKAKLRNMIDSIKRDLHSMFSQITMVPGKDNRLVIDYGETKTTAYRGAFEWAIEFPELLDEKGSFQGFDCIIGNPPYGLLNKKQNQNTSISVSGDVLEYYKNCKDYEWARGGVLNIYRMFICRCFALLKNDGFCCQIFQLGFMGDFTNAKIRQYVMENTKVDFIEAFPERDNENKRVFKEVKMSVCILGATKRRMNAEYKFPVRIHSDNFVDVNNEAMLISYKDVKNIDETYKAIPLIKKYELPIFLKMTDGCKRMSSFSKCYTGEVDISLDKKFITTSKSDSAMLRGAQVQKYYITNDISQGDILFLKEAGYLEKNTGVRSRHHETRRIVMQGITGINEKWRLKMTMAYPPYFCANSVNYLRPSTKGEFDYFILGILNSKLLNWYFAKLSTNSNVNGYEIDSLPIKLGTNEQQIRIKKLVHELLDSPNNNDDMLKEIDEIVYAIYGISENEIPIIEGKL